MKKRILLFTAIAGFGALVLSSYSEGPATFGYNRTGAQASTTNCSGSGCHGTAAGPTVTITVDSGSTAVTKYVPGATYTIKIHGAGTTNNYFGFQFASVSGTGATQVQAGTASSLPANVGDDALSGLDLIEHNAKLAATSAGVYDVSFQWTAPATNVGNVTLYCTLNAVNGNRLADAGDVDGNTNVVLAEEPALAIANVLSNAAIKAYPNPVSSDLHLQLDGAAQGAYMVQVYSLNGQCIATGQATVSGSSFTTSLSAGNWAPGLYSVVITTQGGSKVIPVVKQ